MFLHIVFLLILLIDQVVLLSSRQVDSQSDSLTSEQLKGLDEYFSRKLNEEYLTEISQSTLPKREDSSSMQRVLDCIQRSKFDHSIRTLCECYRMVKNHRLHSI